MDRRVFLSLALLVAVLAWSSCGSIVWPPQSPADLPQVHGEPLVSNGIRYWPVDVVLDNVGLNWPVQHFMVEMSDGVKLFTSVWVLKGKEETPSSAVLDRSPYGPTTEATADLWLPQGFVAVMQNMRATGLSEGRFCFWHCEAADAASTMEWMIGFPWSNSIVFATGASADGMNAYAMLLQPQPNLKALFPFWATGQAYETVYQNGAFRESLVKSWLESINAQRPWEPSYVDFIYTQEAYSDWWAQISLDSAANITQPLVHWAGWYDIFLQVQLNTFATLQAGSGRQRLVVGPRGHCFFEDYRKFPDDRYAEIFSYELATELFLTLSGEPADVSPLLNLTLYVMGSNETNAPGNYWTTLADWPAATPQPWYLSSGQALSRVPEATQASVPYVYNPADPVPTIGGNNLFIPCGPMDQTPVEGRADVLLFTTSPFTEPLAIAGSIVVTLYVSSSANDTDFTVKVTDVFPDGGPSILLTDSIQRMRWRNSDTAPDLMVPGTIYEVTIEMWASVFIFNAGHSIRLAVSSSNAPRFAPNPNNGYPIAITAEYPPIVATNTLWYGGQLYPSFISFPVVTEAQLPANVKLT